MLRILAIAACPVLAWCGGVSGEVVVETVLVGNAGNTGEWAGESYGGEGPDRICGAVGYSYYIGKYEITTAQYTEFLNAVGDADAYGLYDPEMWSNTQGCKIERLGLSGSYWYRVAADRADRPVTSISWGDAARFCNWLHNGQPAGAQNLSTTEDGSYYLNGATTNIELMTVFRQDDATWVIPTEDEWYKAAYHKNDGATGSYFDYPTSNDTVPSNDLIDPDPGNNATFYVFPGDYTISGPYYYTEIGAHENSESPYGTFDQGGNVWERTEAIVVSGLTRCWRGGSRTGMWDGLYAPCRFEVRPDYASIGSGVRIARVPGSPSPALIEWAESCADHGGTEVCLDLDSNNIEPRLSGVHRLAFEVDRSVSSVITTASCDSQGDYEGTTNVSIEAGLNGSDTRVVVEFTPALPDQDCCLVTLSFDADDSFYVRTLRGDVDRNGVVLGSDMLAVKPFIGQEVSGPTAFADLDANGEILGSDMLSVKPYIGNVAPDCPYKACSISEPRSLEGRLWKEKAMRPHLATALATGLVLCTVATPAWADDVDSDGVDDVLDVCNNTPFGTAVDTEGRPLGDIDLDCDTDLDDFALFQQGMTGPLAYIDKVLVPGGEFEMGDPWSEGDLDERPVHTVYLSPYFIDTLEVSNRQYANALNWAYAEGDLITVTDGVVYQQGTGTSYPYCETYSADVDSRIHWDGLEFTVTAGKENHPVVEVTWYGAAAYCNWRSGMGGKPLCYDLSTWTCDFTLAGYRLPTEAEWEKAAGWDPDHGRHFRFGDYSDGCGSYCLDGQRANFADSGDPYEAGDYPRTTPVGFYNGQLHHKADFDWPGSATTYQTQDARSYYGCYDMSGNVLEWCHDWYDPTYYNFSPYANPRGPFEGTHRVARGGFSVFPAEFCRSAYRHSIVRAGVDYVGFRCVLGIEGEPPSCTDDADCDDGLFCSGVETCIDIGTDGLGVCAYGDYPCSVDQTCDEDNDYCVNPEGELFVLTPANDTFIGGSGDDTFDGHRVLDFGNLIPTLNNGDVLDGGGGTDYLYAQLEANLMPQALNGIEIFDLEWLTSGLSGAFSFANADSVITVNNINPQAAFAVNNIVTAAENFGLTNAQHSFTVTVNDQALTGTDDTCTLTLTGVADSGGAPIVTIQPDAAGSGYETITVNSAGAIDNSIDQLVDGLGTSWNTLNIIGDRGLTIDQALAATVTTIDAASAAGNLDITLPAAVHAVTGSAGNDVFRFGAYFDSADALSGGEGTDTLETMAANVVGTTAPQTNVMGIETIRVTNAINGHLNVAHYGATNATIGGKDGTARTVTLPSGGLLEITNDIGANDLDVAVSSPDTTNDALTVWLNGTAATGVDFTGNLDASGFEHMAMMSIGTAQNGDNDYDLAAITLNSIGGVAESITITGSQNLDIGGMITAEVIDASAFTGIFDNSDGMVTAAASITTGFADDLIDGSNGADMIHAGAGSDRIEGKAGSDLLTGGTGNDTYDFDGIALADTDTITDFNAATNTSAADILAPDLSTINGRIGTLTDTSDNSAVAGDGTFVQLVTPGQTIANADLVGLLGTYTNAANALANEASWRIVFGAALDDNDAIMVAYTSGSDVRIALCEVNGASANSSTIDGMWDIAILRNVSLTNLDSNDYAITD